MSIKLYEHQKVALKKTEQFNRVAYWMDMGTGKSFVGSEKMTQLDGKRNLIVCQRSLIDMWVNHIKTYYPEKKVSDYTTKKTATLDAEVIIINYDLLFRRAEFSTVQFDTIMLDESSMIQNENAKRSRFILNKLKHRNVILLSGTPTSGRYEKLWSQCRLLGWRISKKDFYDRYVIERPIEIKNMPYPIKIVVGYKNVEDLKRNLRNYGAYFLKTEDVLTLPEQTFITVDISASPLYRRYRKNKIVETPNGTLVGDTTLKRFLHERQLCGEYCKEKLEAFSDLLDSTDDRLIVFYNFVNELNALKKIAKGRPISEVNGSNSDLTAYENHDNSVTFIQYQAGAMGLNLQKANKIVYFTLPVRSELFEQSKKRIHRIGQKGTCYYYTMICKGTIEEKIMQTLNERRDYTDRLFQDDEKSH